MKKVLLGLLPLLFIACQPSTDPLEPDAVNEPSQVAACDWIRGGGVGTTGGEGGMLLRVTKLTDERDPGSGQPATGTLRYACSQKGPRVVVFTVAGTIHLESELKITEGDLTLAGQTAPGDGICVADYPVTLNKANNVIIRYMRFRMGDAKKVEGDAFGCNNSTNVVVDHCSMSWSTDECVSCYGNRNFTLQNCFITESLTKSIHIKGDHGYGGIWGGENVTFHHNLLAHHSSRNPRFDHDYVNTMAGPIDYINNVVYNWGGNSTYGGEGSTKGGGGRKINFVNNYYKAGPASSDKSRLMEVWASCDNCTDKLGGKVESPHVYLSGNVVEGYQDVTADNWKGFRYKSGASESAVKVDTRYSFTNAYTAEQTAAEAYEFVLAKGGCSLVRDVLDEQVVADVRSGSYKHKGSNGSKNGLIDTQSDAGGWPELKGEKKADSDVDGMPDEWELAQGLDPKNSKDALQKTLVTGHTNLEVYLCDIVKHLN